MAAVSNKARFSAYLDELSAANSPPRSVMLTALRACEAIVVR